MTIITDDLIAKEVKRLYEQLNPHVACPLILTDEELPQDVSFYVRVGERTKELTVPLEALLGPIEYLSALYLRPLVEKHFLEPI